MSSGVERQHYNVTLAVLAVAALMSGSRAEALSNETGAEFARICGVATPSEDCVASYGLNLAVFGMSAKSFAPSDAIRGEIGGPGWTTSPKYLAQAEETRRVAQWIKANPNEGALHWGTASYHATAALFKCP